MADLAAAGFAPPVPLEAHMRGGTALAEPPQDPGAELAKEIEELLRQERRTIAPTDEALLRATRGQGPRGTGT